MSDAYDQKSCYEEQWEDDVDDTHIDPPETH